MLKDPYTGEYFQQVAKSHIYTAIHNIMVEAGHSNP
jgi:hypothetical protein